MPVSYVEESYIGYDVWIRNLVIHMGSIRVATWEAWSEFSNDEQTELHWLLHEEL